MAGEIITTVFSIVSALYSCSSNNRCCYLLGLQENKDALNTAMEELKVTRDNVKRKVDEAEDNPNELMQRTKEVDNWLQRAQTIEGEVDQILQKVDQEIEGRCFGGSFPINCRSAHKIGKLVDQKLKSVNDLKSKGDKFGEVAHKLPLPSIEREPMDSTVGMESMFEKVWRLLAEDEVRIMGLYGYGGVGKTTLLKQINNAFLESTTTSSSSSSRLQGFDVVILVVVSKLIDIVAIQKVIGDRLGLLSPDRKSIFKTLTKKRFVLLLDDIWDRVDLEKIGVPRPSEKNKSKVVFTTRSEIVCGHMDADRKFRVECLPWDEAWTLFQEKVGNETLNCLPKVSAELAEDVARECGGLPLALITIGRAMSSKKTVQEWKHAKTTLQRYASEFSGMSDEVLPLLKLSYDSLRNDTIKSCFLYCALFPEDQSIDKAKLIDYWIGEGLISLSEFNNLDDARNKGYVLIGDLQGACLLESTGEDEEENEVLKMHDMIRDLALWIAHDCESSKRDKMLIIQTSDLTAESSWDNAERIYLILPPPLSLSTELKMRETEVPLSTELKMRETEVPLKSPKLITLIHHPSCNLSVVPQNFYEFTPLLQVLDLSHSRSETLSEFPMSITELVELRYLSLSDTPIKQLPEELGKLVKLNFLDLSYMWDLTTIPSGVIGSLLKLRVLNLFESRQAYWYWDEVYKLTNLNDLGITINTQHDLNKLLSNQNLQMCTTHLALQGEANMVMGIQQHLGSSCFQNLIQIEIRNCSGLKDLTWVGYVPNLNKLYVTECEELEEIIIVVIDDLGGSQKGGGGGGGGNEIIFKSLKTLEMRALPKLKTICKYPLAFPCLETMKVGSCPQLKKLPFDSGSNPNNTLQRIAGGPKWWIELHWEEDHNNNNNNELLKSFLPYFREDSSLDGFVEEDQTTCNIDSFLDDSFWKSAEEDQTTCNIYSCLDDSFSKSAEEHQITCNIC